MSPEQRLTLTHPTPRTASTNAAPAASAVSEVQRSSRPGLTAEELEALREVWSTPLIVRPAAHRPALLH
jgi:hypothetical protein